MYKIQHKVYVIYTKHYIIVTQWPTEVCVQQGQS